MELRLHPSRDSNTTRAPVILIGEILGGGTSWAEHAHYLSGSRTVYTATPDLVSYAAKGCYPPQDWGIKSESRSLRESLNNLLIGKVHVAGWSMGGTIALDYALTYPETILTLTLVEPQIRWLLRAEKLHVQQQVDDLEKFKSFSNRVIDQIVVGEFLRMVGAIGDDEVPEESRAWRLAWDNRLAISNAWKVVTHEEHPKRLLGFNVPTLLVNGEGSGLLDQSMIASLGQLIPTVSHLVLPGLHTSHITSLGEFLRKFEEFVDANQGP